MRRLIADKPILQYPSEVRSIWYTRNKELEPEVFERLPKWMAPEVGQGDVQSDMSRLVADAFETISPKEAKVLRFRYWHDLTLDEIGQIFDLTRERIRQIEARALRKLRHPSRSEALRPFVDECPKALRADEDERGELLDKQLQEEELLQKYLQYKLNRLNESIRENT